MLFFSEEQLLLFACRWLSVLFFYNSPNSHFLLKLIKTATEFVCLSSAAWAPVQLSVCRVQQDSAGVFPVGAEECRCNSPGALGVWFVCTANQPTAGSATSLCLLLWIQGTITTHCHYSSRNSLLVNTKGVKNNYRCLMWTCQSYSTSLQMCH